MSITISGLQEAQKANAEMIAAMRPAGHAGRMIQTVIAALQRHATAITHVDTGALRASHRAQIEHGFTGLRGRVFIDPAAVGRYGRRPAVYGPVEELRGGTHAFYSRTYREAAPGAVQSGIEMLLRGLPR